MQQVVRAEKERTSKVRTLHFPLGNIANFFQAFGTTFSGALGNICSFLVLAPAESHVMFVLFVEVEPEVQMWTG